MAGNAFESLFQSRLFKNLWLSRIILVKFIQIKISHSIVTNNQTDLGPLSEIVSHSIKV